MYNNCCVSFVEAPFVYRIMGGGTSESEMCKLILNCSAIFMEKNCELEWSSDNGGMLHKRDKSATRHLEPRGVKIRKLADYKKLPKLARKSAHLKGDEDLVNYGELIILGYNGSLPQGDRRRKRSKFKLYKRPEPNGIKKSTHCVVQTPHSSQAILDPKQHAVSCTLSRNQTVIVEYIPDESTDMFQIGRSAETTIDFVVIDTVPGNKTAESKVDTYTVSRFACRILADRSTKVCRIYAAGFDTQNNIFLGEQAPKWQENDGAVDGLTTNGILVMHPKGSFCSGEAKCGHWWETSITGKVLSRRESRLSQEKGQLLEGETNILEDGTLIDLCGATLLWRSAEGLAESPNKHVLMELIDMIIANERKSITGHNTTSSAAADDENQQLYVYLNCGHVFEWKQEENDVARKCPICLQLGPLVEACPGLEPAFYVDCGPITYAFNPCGHMATEKTVKYWADMPVPHGTKDYHAICPFCASPLSESPGYVRLIFEKSA